MKKMSTILIITILAGMWLMGCEKSPMGPDASSLSQSDIAKKPVKFIKINDGILLYPAGHSLQDQPLKTGVDIFGYNFQGKNFNGFFINAYLGAEGYPPYDGNDQAYLEQNPEVALHWAWPFKDAILEMHWNDSWLSNKDKNLDGFLDRHYNYFSYLGSGAQLTNLITWSDDWGDHSYYAVIQAAPLTAVSNGFEWFNEDGTNLGRAIWESFIIVEEAGDPFISPAAPGVGVWIGSPVSIIM